MSKSLYPDGLSGLNWVQIVCKCYKQTPLEGKELLQSSFYLMVKFLVVENEVHKVGSYSLSLRSPCLSQKLWQIHDPVTYHTYDSDK